MRGRGGGGGGGKRIPIPTNITTIIKALIFIIIIIQQQSYQWVAGHDGQYNCHAFTFWGSGTTVTGITNTNVKSPQCLLMLHTRQRRVYATLVFEIRKFASGSRRNISILNSQIRKFTNL